MNAMSNTTALHYSTVTERQALALDEIRQLHAAYADLLRKTDEDRRTIDRQADRIALLVADLRTAQQEGKVWQRKLIRLASAMSSMSRLAQDADEIMRSVVDWVDETPEEAQAEQESAQQAVANLPVSEVA
jgi:hypothetical protein